MNGPVSDAPRVTVLMTVYNGLPYLREAIESVLAQTFSDFELLVIDDASTDGSVACIRSYADPRIRLVCNTQNAGQAGAMNQGLALARGETIARLDQDDVCVPDRLRRQMEFLQARPELAGVGSWQICIGPDGRKIGFEPGASDLAGGDFGTFAGLLWTQATPVGHPTVMIRRQVVSDAGGYEEAFAPTEDYALWTRLALARRGLGVIPDGLVKVRIHPRQQSAEKLQVQREKGMLAHQRFIASFCGGQENPEEISAFLRMDEACWTRFRSTSEVRRLFGSLDRVMERASNAWKLSSKETASFRRRVNWWLARGSVTGALRKNTQCLALAGCLLRRDFRTLRFPSLWLTPAARAVSPLMVPALRRFFGSWAKIAKRQRTRFRYEFSRVSL